MTEPTTTGSSQLSYEPQMDSTTAPQVSRWNDLRSRAAGVRDQSRIVGADAEELHREVQDYDLSDRAAVHVRRGHAALLEELSNFGLGWNEIATAAGVSLSAVRKWRNGGDCSADNRMALARLVALIELATEAMIEDAAGWLLTPVVDGYTIRHLDLIAADRPDLVLDFAFQRKGGRDVLDEFDSEWRDHYRRKFDVVTDGDGVRSLKRRETPER
ncbi:hypothetical protein [Nocardioides sp. CER19]|uniref:hypothetical protein n=1 Tax=Nocardioides sp. CER19 TaxID=3038538 RepID=UPI00244C4CCA|nr:hypothetical protein [Nocardioides sp. CER19]MDH2414340.1 hypothetical protein [Nocardioides sp. CER19]